jgi:hypothetical protein
MLFPQKKMAKKAPKLSKNHDLQETDEFCMKRHKISQALLNFRCLKPILPALVRRDALLLVNLSYSDSHEFFLLAPGDEAGNIIKDCTTVTSNKHGDECGDNAGLPI